ncbi:MAG: hypothetical protein RMX65_020475 [Nostoc sp. DedQUE01]
MVFTPLDGSCSWEKPRHLLMGETTPLAHGGNHATCSWGKLRQLLMGETPKTALAPQDRTGSSTWGDPKTALATLHSALGSMESSPNPASQKPSHNYLAGLNLYQAYFLSFVR